LAQVFEYRQERGAGDLVVPDVVRELAELVQDEVLWIQL